MKRICLLGATIAAVLIIGVASALAATSHASKGGKKSKTPSTVTTKVSCASSLTLQVPAGATDVSPASQDGTEMGTTNCAPIGKGVEVQSFTTEDSGDLTGKWQAWFGTGSVFGTFTLTPSDNNPPTTTTSFSQASYTGTLHRQERDRHASPRRPGPGRSTCSTQDSVHFSCKQKGKVTTPAPKTTSKK